MSFALRNSEKSRFFKAKWRSNLDKYWHFRYKYTCWGVIYARSYPV